METPEVFATVGAHKELEKACELVELLGRCYVPAHTGNPWAVRARNIRRLKRRFKRWLRDYLCQVVDVDHLGLYHVAGIGVGGSGRGPMLTIVIHAQFPDADIKKAQEQLHDVFQYLITAAEVRCAIRQRWYQLRSRSLECEAVGARPQP